MPYFRLFRKVTLSKTAALVLNFVSVFSVTQNVTHHLFYEQQFLWNINSLFNLLPSPSLLTFRNNKPMRLFYWTCIRTYFHTYTHTHRYMHLCIHTWVPIYIRTYKLVYIHTYIIYKHTRTCIYACLHTYVHTYTHKHTHTCKHTYIRIFHLINPESLVT